MKKNNYCLCYVFYFEFRDKNKWVEMFRQYSLAVANELGLEITHFDPKKDDNNWKSKAYRYIKRNQNKLTGDYAEEKLKSLSFYSVADNNDFMKSPLILYVSKEEFEKKYNIMNIEIKIDVLINRIKSKEFSRLIVDKSFEIFNTSYGLVHLMEYAKFPGLYFSDMPASTELSDEEKENAKAWGRKGKYYKQLLRDIYWGNIISRSHWNNDKSKEKYIIKSLEYECKGLLYWVNDDVLFFNAPFDITDYENYELNMKSFKQRVKKIFTDCDIEVLS